MNINPEWAFAATICQIDALFGVNDWLSEESHYMFYGMTKIDFV